MNFANYGHENNNPEQRSYEGWIDKVVLAASRVGLAKGVTTLIDQLNVDLEKDKLILTELLVRFKNLEKFEICSYIKNKLHS